VDTAVENVQHHISVFIGKIRIVFGANGRPENGDLTTPVMSITAKEFPMGQMEVWPFQIQPLPWRTEEDLAIGEVQATNFDLYAMLGIPSIAATPMPLEIETTQATERRSLLNHAGQWSGRLQVFRCVRSGSTVPNRMHYRRPWKCAEINQCLAALRGSTTRQ
jgi:hypothetical protein